MMSAITLFEEMYDTEEDAASPEFYCEGGVSNLVVIVSNADLKGKFIAIHCDGDMLIEYNGETITNCHQLRNSGITNDSDLSDIFDEVKPGSQVIMNPWFDFYDQDGNHLDMVFHDIHIAMEEAKNILYKIQKEQYENIG
jgi:hypothetical protein